MRELFFVGITMILILVTATTAMALSITDLGSKDAAEIMDNWDSLSEQERGELVREIANGADPLKLGEMYNLSKGGQGIQLLETLNESSTLKFLNKVDESSTDKGMKLIQELPIKWLLKFMKYSAEYNNPTKKLQILEMASVVQLRTLIPSLEPLLKSSLIKGSEDEEVLQVVLELLDGKCKSTKAKTSASKKKSKPKEEPPKEEKKIVQVVTGQCSEEQKADNTCTVPQVAPPAKKVLIP